MNMMHKGLERLHPYFIKLAAHRGWFTSQLSPAPKFPVQNSHEACSERCFEMFPKQMRLITS